MNASEPVTPVSVSSSEYCCCVYLGRQAAKDVIAVTKDDRATGTYSVVCVTIDPTARLCASDASVPASSSPELLPPPATRLSNRLFPARWNALIAAMPRAAAFHRLGVARGVDASSVASTGREVASFANTDLPMAANLELELNARREPIGDDRGTPALSSCRSESPVQSRTLPSYSVPPSSPWLLLLKNTRN